MFYPTEFYSEEYVKEQKIKAEKRKIRKAANLLGVAFLIMTAIMVLWSLPLGFLAGLGIIKQQVLFDFLNDTTALQGIQIGISSLAFILSYFIYAKIMGRRLSDICAFNKPKKKGIVFPYVIFGFGACGIANILTNIAGAIFQSMGFEYELNLPEEPTSTLGIILAFIATAVTPALVEEFAMRGSVFGVLKKYGNSFAIITSAAVFGLMHGNFAQIPFAFIVGLYFAFVTVKTGTIWTAVIIHFFNNFISLALSYLTKGMSQYDLGIINVIYMGLLLLLGVVGFFLLYKKGEADFTVENEESLLTTPQKLKVFFTAPCMIIVYIVVLIEAIFVYA